MKLSCLQENLQAGLDTVRRAVASRSTLPIVQSVLLCTENGMLTLHATDLEMSITTRIGAMIEEEGATVVPFKLLSGLARSLAPDRVDLEIVEPDEDDPTHGMKGNRMLQIKCGKSVTNVTVADPADFPPTPEVPDEINVAIEVSKLRTAIGMVVPAAATEPTRPVLTAVHMTLQNDVLEMAAADGFRLSMYRDRLSADLEENISVNVPARSISEVQRLAGRHDGTVRMAMSRVDPATVRFTMDQTVLVSQLIVGQFPNYEQLIPDRYETRVIVELEDFRRATQSAAVLAKDNSSNIVRLESELNPDEETGTMVVSGRSEEIGHTRNEFQVEQIDGPGGRIAFNVRYLESLINTMGKGRLAMEINDSSAPAVFRMADEDQQDKFAHVVMPMHVQW